MDVRSGSNVNGGPGLGQAAVAVTIFALGALASHIIGLPGHATAVLLGASLYFADVVDLQLHFIAAALGCTYLIGYALRGAHGPEAVRQKAEVRA